MHFHFCHRIASISSTQCQAIPIIHQSHVKHHFFCKVDSALYEACLSFLALPHAVTLHTILFLPSCCCVQCVRAYITSYDSSSHSSGCARLLFITFQLILTRIFFLCFAPHMIHCTFHALTQANLPFASGKPTIYHELHYECSICSMLCMSLQVNVRIFTSIASRLIRIESI